MKHLIKSAILGLTVAVFAAPQVSAETVLRYNDGGPNRGTRAGAEKFFASEVERLSGGDLKLEIHWGGALLKWKAAAGGIAAGTADMGAVIAAYAPKPLRALAIGDLPIGQSNDAWIGMRAMYDLMNTNKQLQQALAKQNLVYLSSFHTTGLQLECAGDNKIMTVEDVKGKKMRASGVYAKILKDLGANIVSMTYGKVYQAYDSGLIECAAGYYYANRAYKIYEVVDSFVRSDWGQIGGFGIVINKDVWNELTDKQRRVLRQAGINMVDYFAELQIKEVDKVHAAMLDGSIGKKLDVSVMAPAERQKFIDAGKPYVDGWVGDMTKQGFNGQKIWDEYGAFLTKYTKERDSKGYPWAR